MLIHTIYTKMAYNWLFITFIFKGLSLSTSSMCLKWQVTRNALELTCKVDKLNFPIYFYNPSNIEYAFCLPPSPPPYCSSHYQNASISQDLSTNVTSFSLKGNLHEDINGIWACRHGSHVDIADAVVRLSGSNDHSTFSSVSVSAPKIVKIGELFNITCTGTGLPLKSSANIAINGQFHTNITLGRTSCYNTTSSVCTLEKCYCSGDGMSFVLRYTSMKAGVLAITCSMDFRNIGAIGDCIFVNVNKYPVLLMADVFSCRSAYTSITLSCNLVWESKNDHFQFGSWEHSFNGVFLRNITGVATNNVSTLTIDPCSYVDSGEYICNAIVEHGEDSIQLSKKSQVIVKGPPIVISTSVIIGNPSVVVLKFLSIPKPYHVQWLINHHVLNDTNMFNWTMKLENVAYKMHQQTVSLPGYVSNLTLFQIIEEDSLLEIILQNEIGGTSKEIYLNPESKASNTGRINTKLLIFITIGVIVGVILVIGSALLERWYRKGVLQERPTGELYLDAPNSEINMHAYSTAVFHHYDDVDVEDRLWRDLEGTSS